MLVNTEGIVLKKVAYSGSSAIVTIYTRRFGQTPFIVRGLGRKGGKSAALQALSRVEISCSYREKNQIQSLSSISLKPEANILMGPLKGAVALFLTEMLFKALREESADEDLYDYLDAALDFFEKDDFSPGFHLIFLMKLTRFLGFFPSGKMDNDHLKFDLLNGNFTQNTHASLHMLDRELTHAFCQLTTADFQSKLSLKNPERRNILKALVEYYQLHLEGLGEIKSLPVLTEIFSGYSGNPP